MSNEHDEQEARQGDRGIPISSYTPADHEHAKHQAKARLLDAISFLRFAVKDAQGGGQRADFGILSVDPVSGGGRVIAHFDAVGIMADLALVIDAPPQTEADDLEAAAHQFIDTRGLRP